MCGRFALGIPKKRLEEVFGVAAPDEYASRFNIAPGGDIFVVIGPEGEHRLESRWWGLVPHWAKARDMGHSMINARSETLFEKPAFSEAARYQRCLVPAQAFYEWQRLGHGKQPYAIGVNEQDVFGMAGITARWVDSASGEVVDSVAIVTCEANQLVGPIHDRMPVILPREAWALWLDPSLTEPRDVAPLLTPYPAEAMGAWLVPYGVNNPAHEDPGMLDPITPVRQGRLI